LKRAWQRTRRSARFLRKRVPLVGESLQFFRLLSDPI
jgi:hypothetical protein